jgi:hypothetical protein
MSTKSLDVKAKVLQMRDMYIPKMIVPRVFALWKRALMDYLKIISAACDDSVYDDPGFYR